MVASACPPLLFEGGRRRLAMAWQAMGAVSRTKSRIMRATKIEPGLGNSMAAARVRRMTPSEEALVAA
jgi:hypothetical protein